MGKKSYSDKLKDPRWQKKRLEIFERDKWVCRICKRKTEMFTVHHFYYIPDTDPWDYSNNALITLCSDCHESEYQDRQEVERELIDAFRELHFLNGDLEQLKMALWNCKPPKLVESFCLVDLLSHILQKPKLLQKIADEFNKEFEDWEKSYGEK